MNKILDDIWKIVESTCVINNSIDGNTAVPEKYFKQALENYLSKNKITIDDERRSNKIT